MLLKRKRSESELSFSSAFSSPPRPGSSSFDFGSMAVDTQGQLRLSRSTTPAHLPSRTMKRFRDNRPSETEVHHHTLDLLYSAQQHHQQPLLSPQPQLQESRTAPAPSVVVPSRDVGQRSLHSFWRLPGSASSSLDTPPAAAAAAPAPSDMAANCEDCGAGLGGGDDMMDVVGCGGDHSCSACGKVVCFSCSVSNLGDHRRCLVCAGRRVRTGGVGWTNGPGEVLTFC